jgi:hypothetical protein
MSHALSCTSCSVALLYSCTHQNVSAIFWWRKYLFKRSQINKNCLSVPYTVLYYVPLCSMIVLMYISKCIGHMYLLIGSQIDKKFVSNVPCTVLYVKFCSVKVLIYTTNVSAIFYEGTPCYKVARLTKFVSYVPFCSIMVLIYMTKWVDQFMGKEVLLLVKKRSTSGF